MKKTNQACCRSRRLAAVAALLLLATCAVPVSVVVEGDRPQYVSSPDTDAGSPQVGPTEARSAGVTGALVDVDGKPGDGYVVRCLRDANHGGSVVVWTEEARVLTGDDGSFALRELMPGVKLLRAERAFEGRAEAWTGRITVIAGENVELGFIGPPSLRAGGAGIAGRVLDPQGVPIGSARVFVTSQNSPPVRVSCDVDSNGRFEVAGLGAGVATIGVRPTSPLLRSETRRVELQPGRMRGCTIRLAAADSYPSGVLALEVELPEEIATTPAAVLRLWPLVYDQRGGLVPVQYAAKDPHEGTLVVRLRGLAPGRYDLRLCGWGYGARREDVAVHRGNDVVRLTLKRNVTIVGRVVDARGQPLRAKVARELSDGRTIHRQTCALDGTFVHRSFAPGEDGTVVIEAEGHVSQWLFVNGRDMHLGTIALDDVR